MVERRGRTRLNSDEHIVLRIGFMARVAILIAGNVLFGTGLFFHAFLYNFYLEALNLSEVVMGHAAAALTAGGLAALLPAGWLVDRLGSKTAVSSAALIGGVGLSLGAIVTTPVWIYAAAVVAGAGGGLWRVAVAPILMGITDQRNRPRAFAWNVGLLVASGGVAMAVAGSVPEWLTRAWSFERLEAVRIALLVGAGGTVSSVSLFLILQRPNHVAAAAADTRLAGRKAPSSAGVARELLPLVALVAAWMLGPGLAAPFFNIYFSRIHDLGIDRIGLVFAAAHLAWGVAVFGSGEVAARFGVQRVLTVSLLLFAPAIWGMAVSGAVTVAMALYLLQGLVSPVTNPLIDQALLERAPPRRHGAVSSWRNAAADVSAMVGASVGGGVLSSRSFHTLFVSSGTVGLLGALGLIAALRYAAKNEIPKEELGQA